MATIGKRNTLSVTRASTIGLYLDGGELGEILLPERYVPKSIAPKDQLDVFIYLDSEDRLVATTEEAYAEVGDFACLKVVSVNDRVGAFLDWGLQKDLLLPFREMTGSVRPGSAVVVYVLLDEKSRRIIATARFNKYLKRQPPNYRPGQPVNLMIIGKSPLGYTALIEGSYSGLLYSDTLSAPLIIGDKMIGYIRSVRPDGKIDLSLDESGYKRVASLKDQIVEALARNNGRLDFDDDSSPAAIRQAFGVSKKAFKQALGALYKQRRIRFLKPGVELLNNSSWEPGKND